MDNSKKNRSLIIKKGIMDAVTSSGRMYDENAKGESKQMSAREAAMVFEDVEIEMLKKEYECLEQTPSQIAEKINEEVIGQEDVVSKIVHVAYYNQKANFVEDCGFDAPKRINMLLIGPTGCGKTSSINALKKYFKVPLAKYNSDSITSAGYIGNKVEDILLRLFEEAGCDLALAERGIIYIDEIDKKVVQLSSAGKDVNGKAVQEELLKVLEPNVVDILYNRSHIHFDTSRLTVIMGGTFVGLDKIREKRLRKNNMGFRSKGEEVTDEEIANNEFIPQDIIDFGFIPEFVGRIVMIGELRKLDKKDVMKIILHGKNSPYIEKTRFLADILDVEQQISMDYLEKVASELAESETGARSLESRMTNLFYPIIQEAFEHVNEYGICIIDSDGNYSLEYDGCSYGNLKK